MDDRVIRDRLNIHPRTDGELRDVLAGFEHKWQSKARRLMEW